MRNEHFWTWFNETARPKLSVRADTFAQMFEHLDTFDHPVVIIETGCMRRSPYEDGAWHGDGCSTIMFDRYVHDHGRGMVISIDIDPEATAVCKKFTEHVIVQTGDSIEYLDKLAKAPEFYADLIYLDSFDFVRHDPLPSAIHHHKELMAAMPMIRPETLVVVDDSPLTMDDSGHGDVGGKGFLVARHMALSGADLMFCAYQSGWTNVGPARVLENEDIRQLIERAREHFESNRVTSAEHIYRLVLGITTPPNSGQARVAHGEACSFYAKVAISRGKIGAAADWYREAIVADPKGTDYRLEMITKCFIPMGNLDAALFEAKRAAAIDPDYPKVWKILGAVHHEMSNLTDSIECYERRLSMEPDDADALLDMAMACLSVPDYDSVRECCERAMGSEREADAIHCLAMVAYREHRHEDAIKLYDEAIAANCTDVNMTHWNKSLAMHSIGQYKEGWKEHEYREHNLANPSLYLPMRRFTIPMWRGEPPIKADGTAALIHVHYEAGAGDNIAMVRYLNVLTKMGYRVRYETAPEMVDLMKTSFPDVEIVPKAPDYPGSLGIQMFDYHTPIGSLPAILGTDIDSVPWDGPYIKADPVLVEKFKTELTAKKIGFCWSSGIRLKGAWIAEYGRRKSMHFDQVFPAVKACWDSKFVPIALQIGPERDQSHDIIDTLSKKPSWSETAALIECLDLVITVDTSVAHLAGAMGKPVWLMCQRDGCSWHFMCWRPGAPWNEASPWYPSMRIFRQRKFDQPHYWTDVVNDIVEELRNWK